MQNVKDIIKEHYDIGITDILPQQGGWASLAYKVSNNNQSYFLKVYEKSRTSTLKLTALIDDYVPIMLWLQSNSNLKARISVPCKTMSGDFKCEDDYGIYLLYEYIDGITIGAQNLNENQVQGLSEIITELHSYGDEIPVKTGTIKENFDVPFLQSLQDILRREKEALPIDVWELISTSITPLNNLIQSVEEFSQYLRKHEQRMVLCHTDLHNWNLMQTEEQLILIDWEGVKLAPPEADLMFLDDKPYFSEFLRIYQKTHQDYAINPDALAFYKGKRRLEDIWEFIEQLLYDEQEGQDRSVTLNYLQEELNKINP